MTMRLAVVAVFLAVCVSAAEAVADVAGNWTVTISTADGEIVGRATLKQSGDDVTGVIGPTEDATIPVEGTLTGDVLTLRTKPQPGRTAAFDTCTLTVADGKMAGTIQGGDVGKGRISFVRSRS